MHKETITYVDFNGTERTEDHYFNLSKTEITELEVSMPGGLAEYLMGIVNAKNVPEIMASFKKIILSAYGMKSADGRRLEKGEEISKAFTESPAYDVLFQRLFLSGDVNAASDFINAIIPQIKDDAAQSAAENKNLTVVSGTAQ